MPVDITASQVVTLTIDVDTDGVADPGDTMTFTTTIKNIGDTDATSAEFAQVLDGVTLVPGSINVSPVAFDDSYDAAGNVLVTIPAGSGVMANDVEFFADSFSVTGSPTTSANGGKVSVNADGSFTYTSATGFTGTDSFSYTVTDSKGLTSTATVELDVGPSVWFIDDNASPGGDGSQGSPFNSLAAFNAANAAGGGNQPQTGDFIFLRAGTYTEADGINLKDGQTLVGQGQNLVVNGVTIETGSAGQTPTIVVTGGAATDNAVGLAQNNSVSGLDINVQNAAADGFEDGNGTVGNLTISDVSITGAGQAVDIDQGGALNVTLDSVTSTGSGEEGIQLGGTFGSFTATTVSLSGSAGDAVDLNGHTGTAAINGGSIAAGSANSIAVDIAGGASNVTIAAGITDTNSGDAVEISGRTGGTVSLSGNITASGGASNGIDVSGNSGGTVNFTGAVNLSTGAGAAVNLSSNTGATVNFNAGGNGLDISTTSGSGFSATGGGTVSVTGAGNTIGSGTGTALNVANTTIGAADVTFQSISANGGTNGIILNNTGSLGGLTVTGTGSVDGSGGTVQNTSGRGVTIINASETSLSNINLTNAGTSDLDATNGGLSTGDNLDTNAAIHLQSATTVTLDNININGGAEQGINGNNVANFNLVNSSIENVGNAADEDGIHFFNMTGKSSIVNTTINSSFDDNLNLQTQSGNLDLTIAGGSATNSDQGSGYLFGIRGSTVANINIDGVSSTNNFSGGIVADVFDTATMNLRVNNSTSSGNNDQLSVSAGDSSSVDLEATGNTLSSVASGDFVVISLLGSAFDTGYQFDARIHNNNISVANGLAADGMLVFNAGGGVMNTAVTNNTITYAGTQRAIAIQQGQDGAATTRATITGNNIDVQLDGTGNAVNAILGTSGVADPSGAGSFLDLNIGGAGGLANTITHSLGGTLVGGDIRVRQRFADNVNLDGYVGGATDTAAVAAYLDGRNNEVSPSTASILDGTFSGNASPSFVTVSVSTASVAEDGGTNLVYTLTRNGSTASSAVANFSITGTATAANDFTVSGATTFNTGNGLGTVTFAAGSATAVITVDPTADANSAEFDESVVLDVGNSGTVNGSFARGIIVDDLPLQVQPDDDVPTDPTPDTPTDPTQPTPDTPTGVFDGNNAVSAAELAFMVGAATARWAAAGLDASQVAALEALTFSVENMGGLYLGAFRPGHITLDADAAGYGWFVDATPGDDAEFTFTGTPGMLAATAGGGAAGRMDLLATIMHEMGHALGLEDIYALTDRGDIMYGYLSAGIRRLVDDDRADGAVIGAVTSEEFIGAPISIGTLPSGQQVVIEWRATVDPQTGQFIVDPVNFGTVSGTNFPTENTNSVVIGVDRLTLSGTLFDDLGGDGTKGAGDNGVSGIAMRLYADDGDGVLDAGDTLLGTDTTDGSGDYAFIGLAPGDYIVAFDQVGGLPSVSLNGGDPDNNTNNDSNGALSAGVVSSKAITLSYNSETVNDLNGRLDINDTLDFGVFNAAPVINNLSGDAATWTEGDGPAILDQGGNAAIVEDGASFDAGTLTVSVTGNEVAAEDLIGISTAGTVGLSAGVAAGSVVSVGGVAVGLISTGGAAGDDLLITFDADATAARVAALAAAITYTNTGGDDPTASTRTITFTAKDSGGLTGSANVTVNVIAIDDTGTAQNDAVATDEATKLSGADVFADNGGGVDADPDTALSVALVNGTAFTNGVAITLASGALLTMNADGKFDYDPNGKFNDLPGPASGASNLTATDSFSYTLAGGGTATVTVTVSGLDSDNDVLEGTAGADTFAGGIGDDTYQVDNISDTVTELSGEGTTDRVLTSVSFTLGAGQEIEFLETSDPSGTTAMILRGNALGQTIEGNDGSNFLNDGGFGSADTLIGNGGDDTYAVYNFADTIIEVAGEGVDRLCAGVSYVLGSGVSVEQLNTTSLFATYAVDLTGNELVQLVRGNNGANTLDGGGGKDVLFGMGGADNFRFSTALGAGNVARIGDFSVADDTIHLDDAIFTALTVLGALDASAFKDTATGPKDADDRIIYSSDTGALCYDADGSGTAFGNIRFATITGSPTLTAADFVVV